MRKFQCLLFMLKQSYTCYYIICMAAPLKENNLWSTTILWICQEYSHQVITGVKLIKKTLQSVTYFAETQQSKNQYHIQTKSNI